MIRCAPYGGLGRDPEQRQTRNGNAMTTASVAVNIARSDAERNDTEWFQITAFGKVGDDLARHSKGDLVALMGPVFRRYFVGRDG